MSLPRGQKLALLTQMSRVRAEDELRANPWGQGLSTAAFYDLVLAATGSEDLARQKAKARRAAMIEAGVEAR